MTVKDLFELCKKEIEEGNGDRNIVLCVNGDEFHPLENKFSSPVYNDSAIYQGLRCKKPAVRTLWRFPCSRKHFQHGIMIPLHFRQESMKHCGLPSGKERGITGGVLCFRRCVLA